MTSATPAQKTVRFVALFLMFASAVLISQGVSAQTPGPTAPRQAPPKSATAAGNSAKPAASTGAAAPKQNQVVTHTGSGRFIVLLDAAHGGEEDGAQFGNGTAEKTITLALSVRLRSLLAARGVQVITTRESNVKLSADQRAEIANRLNAAACLSLHATQTGSGVHLFVSSQEPRDPTRFLAWKTAQGAFVTRSLKFASVVNSAFEHSAGYSGSSPDNGQTTGSDSAPISVTLGRTALPGIDSMTCPAVAVEMAPLRGDDHRVVTAVTDSEYQTRFTETLAAAILEWRTNWDADPSFGAIAGRQP